MLGALPLARVPGLQQQRGQRLAAMVSAERQRRQQQQQQMEGQVCDAGEEEAVTLLDVRRWLPRPALVQEFGEVRR